MRGTSEEGGREGGREGGGERMVIRAFFPHGFTVFSSVLRMQYPSNQQQRTEIYNFREMCYRCSPLFQSKLL